MFVCIPDCNNKVIHRGHVYHKKKQQTVHKLRFQFWDLKIPMLFQPLDLFQILSETKKYRQNIYWTAEKEDLLHQHVSKS